MILTLFFGAAIGTQFFRIEHLCLAAPDGYVLERRLGPDFAVFRVKAPADNGSIGFYLGNHPTSFEGENASSARFRLGRRKAEWKMWQEKAADGAPTYHADARMEKPFGTEPAGSVFLHMWVKAPSLEARAALQRIAERVEPAARNPQCPEFTPWEPEVPPPAVVPRASPVSDDRVTVEQDAIAEWPYFLAQMEIAAQSRLPHERSPYVPWSYKVLGATEQGGCDPRCPPSKVYVVVSNYDGGKADTRLYSVNGIRFWSFRRVTQYRWVSPTEPYLAFVITSRPHPEVCRDYEVRVSQENGASITALGRQKESFGCR